MKMKYCFSMNIHLFIYQVGENEVRELDGSVWWRFDWIFWLAKNWQFHGKKNFVWNRVKNSTTINRHWNNIKWKKLFEFQRKEKSKLKCWSKWHIMLFFFLLVWCLCKNWIYVSKFNGLFTKTILSKINSKRREKGEALLQNFIYNWILKFKTNISEYPLKHPFYSCYPNSIYRRFKPMGLFSTSSYVQQILGNNIVLVSVSGLDNLAGEKG